MTRYVVLIHGVARPIEVLADSREDALVAAAEMYGSALPPGTRAIPCNPAATE